MGWLKGWYCCGAEGQWGDRVNKKKSEGKGRTSEREEVQLVRAQTWAKDAGGDAHLFRVVTSSCGGEGQQGRG